MNLRLGRIIGALLAFLTCGRAGGPTPDLVIETLPARTNPFEDARLFVDPAFVRQVEQTEASPEKRELLMRVASFPTAIWLDRISGLDRLGETLDHAASMRADGGIAVVPVFVIYDLPNRDCAAKASMGELALESRGEERYKADFIDVIAKQFKRRPSQRVIVLLEPDSLGNIATNLSVPKCQASATAYRRCIAYAISALSNSNVFVYLDAGHAGWLGWDTNRSAITALYQSLLAAADGDDKIRGFFTNVSNYTPLRGADGVRLAPGNPCPDELTYVKKLSENLASVGISGKGFVIDTGRNGVRGLRSNWNNWCNIRGAGLGERPRASPAPGIDAYFWVKTPGQSDGASDVSDPRFDVNCRSKDAALGAPPAGHWFPSYFLELLDNANPPL